MMEMDAGVPVSPSQKNSSMQNVFESIAAQDPCDMEIKLDHGWIAGSKECAANSHELSVRNEALETAMEDVAAIVSEASSKREKLQRSSFRQHFNSTASTSSPQDYPPVFVVINATTLEKVLESVQICIDQGSCGIFLVNNDFDFPQLLPIVRGVRGVHPEVFLGVNFKMMSAADAFPILGKLAREGVKVDAYWADNAGIDKATADKEELASQIFKIKNSSGWDGMCFGGVACGNPKSHPKLCKPVSIEDVPQVAALAARYFDVVVTSGSDADTPPDSAKVAAFRKGCGHNTLAVCSGLTAENVNMYAKDIDCFLVSSAVQTEAYSVDTAKLQKFLAAVQACQQFR